MTFSKVRCFGWPEQLLCFKSFVSSSHLTHLYNVFAGKLVVFWSIVTLQTSPFHKVLIRSWYSLSILIILHLWQLSHHFFKFYDVNKQITLTFDLVIQKKQIRWSILFLKQNCQFFPPPLYVAYVSVYWFYGLKTFNYTFFQSYKI